MNTIVFNMLETAHDYKVSLINDRFTQNLASKV